MNAECRMQKAESRKDAGENGFIVGTVGVVIYLKVP